MYPDLDGPGVSIAVERALAAFRRQPDAIRAKLPFIWVLLGPKGSQVAKMSKAASGYVDDARVGRAAIDTGAEDPTLVQIPKGQTCGNCPYAYSHVVSNPPVYVCSMIRGSIRPSGWCRFWRPVVKYDVDRFSQE